MPPGKGYDVIVAGLGAMGSATAAHLARRGKEVLGLERWMPGHTNASSHGDSRIIREMYFEHPMYVPLLQRAYELWAELGPVLNIYGGLMIGTPDGMLVSGTLRSAAEYGLAHEVLSSSETRKRYPAFELQSNLVAVVDPRAGWLDPEQCNVAHMMVATKRGADLHFEEPLVSWTATDDGVEVTTSHATYSASHLVLSVGAWTKEVPLEVERQAICWFESPAGPEYERTAFPIWAYEYKPGHITYGFPRLNRGVKASVMHSGEIVANPDVVNREVGDEEVENLRKAIRPVLPALAAAAVRERGTCLFTNTADHNFVIDFHPRSSRVVVSSACSGHGFKFASVVGEIQADLVTEGRSRFDLTPFKLSRL
jgi:sarcosine oxidase